VFKIAEFDDNSLNRIARKIAISEGVPESAFRSSGLIDKKIEVDDKYANKFTAAIEKAKSLLSDEGDKQ
jgi:hypothetical protein